MLFISFSTTQVHQRGAVIKVKVLGCMALIDEGKLLVYFDSMQGPQVQESSWPKKTGEKLNVKLWMYFCTID